MTGYVPTTGQVREAYIVNKGQWRQSAGAGFDTWLDKVRATARREGQADAWADAVASAYLCETQHFTSIKHAPNPYEGDRHVDQ